MRRPGKFLSLIIILLAVNVLFFSLWYAFGGRNLVRKLLTDVLSKAIGAEISVGELHLSDKQIYAENIHFAMADSLLEFDVQSVRVRYNLYKLFSSGFKLTGVLNSVEIVKPVATLHFEQQAKERKSRRPKTPKKLPDLSGYFKKISLTEGSLYLKLKFPLQIINKDYLIVEESFNNINLNVINTATTQLGLKANTYNGATLTLEGSLDQGRIHQTTAEIKDYKPLYVEHPDLKDLRSEINLSAHYHESPEDLQARYGGKAIIWDSSALFWKDYPVKIPLLTAELEDEKLSVRLSRSTIGSSSLEGEFVLADIAGKQKLDGTNLLASFDLGMVLPELSGSVQASARALGSLQEPRAYLNASSQIISYQDHHFHELGLKAHYKDETAHLENLDLRYENQILHITGEYEPFLQTLAASLSTRPVSDNGQIYYATGDIDISGLILSPYPIMEAKLKGLDLVYQAAEIKNLHGDILLKPLEKSLLVEADLEVPDMMKLYVIGDILNQQLALDLDFADLALSEFAPPLSGYQPFLSGQVSALLLGKKLWTKSDLRLQTSGDYELDSPLSLLASLNLEDMHLIGSITSENSTFYDENLKLELVLDYRPERLKIHGLRLGDILNLSGEINPKNWQDFAFDIAVCNLDKRRLATLYPALDLLVPDFERLYFFANYNTEALPALNASLNLYALDLISVIPLDIGVSLAGKLDEIQLDANVEAHGKNLLDLQGALSLLPSLNLDLTAKTEGLKVQEILMQAPLDGEIFGEVSAKLTGLLSPEPQLEFASDLYAKNIHVEDFTIDKVYLKAAQKKERLIVDSLYVISENLFEGSASGELGYNIVANEYFENPASLDIELSGELFPWLKELSDYILESRGVSKISLSIGSSDEEFIVRSGELDIHDGYILLKDQVEAIRNLELRGLFQQNRFIISRGQFNMGNGRFYMNNVFESEPSDHFQLAFLDLGYLRLMIEEPGIQATIPVVAPPKTLSNIALKGQNSRYATIRGPFDDMKIEAYVSASNLDILFPPGADNLLNLILSMRNTGKKPDSDPIPLPFMLDLYVNIGENVRYVTYPTKLSLQPGGFLHLLYDGNNFIVKEVLIVSDRGTVDFLGTVFQVDNISISMIDEQDIMNVDGNFYKRAPDGSTVSLTVRSSPDFDKSLFDRLQLSLASDNPQDQNITQILSRLRYDQKPEKLTEDGKQNALQDEALALIGVNLNSTVLNPFFYPVENWLRRSLGLDSFSINAGFIQNLFTEYSSNPSELGEMVEMKDFANDISRFSSAILLNNLSVSMSKYLGYSFFADYELSLQEATDLQKKMRIQVSHDTSLRLVLPKDYRLGYTFRYKPQEHGFTHEIMIQRTLRFWGL